MNEFGSYQLTETLAAVSGGTLHLARHVGEGTEAWLLEIDAALASDTALMNRLEAEIFDSLGQTHPHLIRFQRLEQNGGRVALLANPVHARSLASVLAKAQKRGSTLSAVMTAAIVGDVCRALTALAEQHLISGAVSLNHVFITFDGRARLLDLGLARASSGDAALDASHAAPEQLLGEPASLASDVFSLGVIFYKLLTGVEPFSAGQQAAGLDIRPPTQVTSGVNETLERLCLGAMAWQAASRPTPQNLEHQLVAWVVARAGAPSAAGLDHLMHSLFPTPLDTSPDHDDALSQMGELLASALQEDDEEDPTTSIPAPSTVDISTEHSAVFAIPQLDTTSADATVGIDAATVAALDAVLSGGDVPSVSEEPTTTFAAPTMDEDAEPTRTIAVQDGDEPTRTIAAPGVSTGSLADHTMNLSMKELASRLDEDAEEPTRTSMPAPVPEDEVPVPGMRSALDVDHSDASTDGDIRSTSIGLPGMLRDVAASSRQAIRKTSLGLPLAPTDTDADDEEEPTATVGRPKIPGEPSRESVKQKLAAAKARLSSDDETLPEPDSENRVPMLKAVEHAEQDEPEEVRSSAKRTQMGIPLVDPATLAESQEETAAMGLADLREGAARLHGPSPSVEVNLDVAAEPDTKTSEPIPSITPPLGSGVVSPPNRAPRDATKPTRPAPRPPVPRAASSDNSFEAFGLEDDSIEELSLQPDSLDADAPPPLPEFQGTFSHVPPDGISSEMEPLARPTDGLDEIDSYNAMPARRQPPLPDPEVPQSKPVPGFLTNDEVPAPQRVSGAIPVAKSSGGSGLLIIIAGAAIASLIVIAVAGVLLYVAFSDGSSNDGATDVVAAADAGNGDDEEIPELTFEETDADVEENEGKAGGDGAEDEAEEDNGEPPWLRNNKSLVVAKSTPRSVVFINGRRVGRSPQWIVVNPGKHKLAFKNPKTKKSKQAQVVVRPRQRRVVRVKF